MVRSETPRRASLREVSLVVHGDRPGLIWVMARPHPVSKMALVINPMRPVGVGRFDGWLRRSEGPQKAHSMSITILHATVEGQSGKIAQFVKTILSRLGHEVFVANTGAAEVPSIGDAAGVVLVAPVHARRHPDHFEATLTALRHDISRRPSLMLSVSMSAAFPEGLADAQDYLDEMLMRTGLEPDRQALVAGAVKLENYDYFAEQVVKWVVLKDRDVDLRSGNHEFTDWDALERIVTDFAEGLAA